MRPSLHFGMCGDDVGATIRFFQDVQIHDLVCDVNQIPGRKEKGILTEDDLHAFVQPFADTAITLAVVTVGWMARDAEGRAMEAQLETITHDITMLGNAGVPVAQLFELGVIPEGVEITKYRRNVYETYQHLVAACAEAGVQLAIHAGWQPEHVLWNTASYLDLFEAVPDSHNGVCFCAGSVYQSGDDVVEAIHRLAGRIHFVHFRDAMELGGECPEMLLGNGKVPFATIVWALQEVGYEGIIHCEHFGRFESESSGAVATAWGAGFMRGIFQTR